MTTLMDRLVGAAALDARTYENVEAGIGSTGQAAMVVLLTSVAGAIGLVGLGMSQTQVLPAEIVRALLAWIAWAVLVYFIGVHLLPGPETHADLGELLRTLGFASTPGLFRILGTVPVVGFTLYLLASLWMLLATIIAVRQALDYRSTGRAIVVCVLGWGLSLLIALATGFVFGPVVS